MCGTPKWGIKQSTSVDMQRFELKVRLPRDVKDWLVGQVAENASSQTSEIVRAVRERMQRVQTESRSLPASTRQSLESEG
jgi:hypothetical protein